MFENKVNFEIYDGKHEAIIDEQLYPTSAKTELEKIQDNKFQENFKIL